jgi:hypothetical protein
METLSTLAFAQLNISFSFFKEARQQKQGSRPIAHCPAQIALLVDFGNRREP